MCSSLMKKLVKVLDPKLDKYREKRDLPKQKYTPKTEEEFIDVLRRTPKTILDDKSRSRIAAIMSFDSRTVGDIMAPKEKIIFVGINEVIGPLTLDKLYRSGYTNFPVVDEREKIKGVIHTEALNALEIKKTDKAEKYIDKQVLYLQVDDTLPKVVEEIERTNGYYFLVLNDNHDLVGFFTVQMLLDYLTK